MFNLKQRFGNMENNVKPRYDGKGSEFGMVHRLLPPKCGMFDIDRMSGNMQLDIELKNTDTGFVEYRTDFNNADVTFTALFEIKYKLSESVQKALECNIGSATFAQKKMCEKLRCRYFIVVANFGKQPFVFFELVNDAILNHGELNYNDDNKMQKINDFWKKLGLL